MLACLETFLGQAERRVLKVKIPREEGLLQKIKGTHFHYKPEFFFQLTGVTHFRFPKEQFDLREQEFCVIPSGLPHGERVEPGREPFRNLVAGFYGHSVSLHFGREVEAGRPDIEVIEFFDAPDVETYLTLTQSLVQAFHKQSPARSQVMQGLLVALLGMLKNLVMTGLGELNTELGKVFEAKWLVREQFSNPDLSVASIAARLNCSPDYLSHLFHKETKEKLIHYIQRIRVEGAALALTNTGLYISEIAYACGFADPAYFARVFKNHKGETPQEFRARLEEKRRQKEESPKTVYFDRVDFSPGAPGPVAPKAG